MQLKNILKWGQKDGTSWKMFAFYVAQTKFSAGTPYGPPNLTRSDPWVKASNKP